MQTSTHTPLATAFGDTLRDLRTEMGLSQSRLSELSGLSVNFISFCERGKKQPSLNSIWLLSFALNIAPDQLIREVMKRGPQPNP